MPRHAVLPHVRYLAEAGLSILHNDAIDNLKSFSDRIF
jgi:hypothetical protein